MADDEILRIINELVSQYDMRAEYLKGAMSVGVAGDDRTYTPVICLIGPWPGHETLADLSTKISNATPINRVTFELEFIIRPIHVA